VAGVVAIESHQSETLRLSASRHPHLICPNRANPRCSNSSRPPGPSRQECVPRCL